MWNCYYSCFLVSYLVITPNIIVGVYGGLFDYFHPHHRKDDSNSKSPFAAQSSNSDNIFNTTTTTTTTTNSSLKDSTTVYEKCGFSSDVRFITWFETIATNSPVLYPTNDTQLAAIVTTAGAAGCKVRVRGNGHSEDGIVMQKSDEIHYNVVVISLKYYLPDDRSWHRSINTTTPSVKMSAGNGQMDLLGYVRPQYWLPATGTIGRLFTLGGVYMNPSTFGGWFEESRLSAHVLSIRLMHANGTIAIYDGTDVIPFRGSMGLLGIVTALEILLRPDLGLKMTKNVLDMQLSNPPYSTDKVESFVTKIVTNDDGCNFFFYPRIDTLIALAFDYDGNKTYNATASQIWYDAIINNPTNNTQKEYSEDFLNDLMQLSAVPNFGKQFGKLIQYNTYRSVSKRFDEQKIIPNDGYHHSFEVANYEQLSYFIKCTTYRCIDDMVKWINITRTYLYTNNYNNPNSRFGDIHLFWRVLTVRHGERLLEHIPVPGYYIGVEIQTMRITNARYQYSYHFKNLEDLWHREFPIGGFHHGKAYAFGPIDSTTLKNEYIPFVNDTMVNTMYNTGNRTTFINLMNLYDPTGVFRAGSVLRMLGLSNDKYTIQQSNGDICYRRSNDGCLSQCCNVPVQSFPPPQNLYCQTRTNRTAGQSCTTSCACNSGYLCQRTAKYGFQLTCVKASKKL